MFLHHADIIKMVYLIRFLYPTECLIFSAQFTQHDGLQGTGLVVMTIADKGAFQFVERIFPAFFSRTDTSRFKIAGISPRLIPRRLPETVVGHILSAQELIDNAQIELWFTIVRIGITFLQHLDSCCQIGFSLLETGTSQVPKAHLHITTIVQRITTQTFFIIIKGAPSRMTILLQVETCQIKLVNSLRFLWRERCLSGIRDRTDFIRLRLP